MKNNDHSVWDLTNIYQTNPILNIRLFIADQLDYNKRNLYNQVRTYSQTPLTWERIREKKNK